MGLAFLNPALLWALGLVGVPILIHLLQRRRFRVVKWGAMEFLLVSQRNRRRKLVLEQLLLLLLRCLIIALVVMAVCRPVAALRGVAPGMRGQVHAIVILDNSYSMGYRATGSGAETVFDRAVRRAIHLVEQGLRQGDAVSIILASDPPRTLIRRPSLDLRAAVGSLRRLKLSDAGTSYGAAARLALAVAGESRFPNREVYLISDNQDTGWSGRGSDPAAWEALARLGRLVMLPVREGFPANVAVEWVQPARGLATARTSSRIQARLVNTGPQTARGVLASLEVDGRPQGAAQRVDVEPAQHVLVAFNHLFESGGVHTCAVRLGPDRLQADDVGYLSLRVRQSVRILVLNGNPDPVVPQRDAAFFLEPALSPPPAGPGAEPVPLEPEVVRGGLSGSDVRQYDVVVLSNVSVLSAADRRLLGEFVQNGGGLLLFPGSRVSPELYNRDLLEGIPSLLPARLGAVRTNKTSLDPGSLDHPALERFRGAQDVDLTTAEFQRYFPLQPRSGDRSVRVMARLATGEPLLVERTFGLGRVVLAASGATTEWNNLPLKPLFLPLLHQLVGYLTGGSDGSRNGQVGEPLTRSLPLTEATRPVSITGPDGATTTLRPVVNERGCLVTLERPERAGFYRLEVPGGTTDRLAVNRNVAESNLRSLDQKGLRSRLPGREWIWVAPAEDLLAAITRARQGVELWRHALLAALALMVLESMLAQVFGRRA